MVFKPRLNQHHWLWFSPLIIVLVVTFTSVQNVGAFSPTRVLAQSSITDVAEESLPVAHKEETEGQAKVPSEKTVGDAAGAVDDEENEIFRYRRDVEVETVTEKVEEVTTNVPFVVSESENDVDENPFVRPITPDPDADVNYPTVNPLPPDFDVANLTDVDVSGDFIQGSRASCQCGKPARRIVGGESASIREYPWMVSLTRGAGQRPFCGGTLVNSRYVVTASHCVYGQTASRITVVLNPQDFCNGNSGSQTVRVEHIKMHENYNSNNIDNDIALLRLAQAVPLGSQYIPVCLPSSNGNDFSREQATVTGFGATSSGGSTSCGLRKVTVPIISNQECNTKSKYNNKITQNMMCAGLLSSGGKDSCQGDSGGPLIINNGGRRTLVGIVSWGYGCAQPQSPGVYTRVARYPDWILANTRGADWCQG